MGADSRRDYGKVGVLCGGRSAERDISLRSGEAVCRALQAAGVDTRLLDIGDNPVDQLKQVSIDRAFPLLHGTGGEDGRIQALLEALKIPYVGSGVAASALAIDKFRTKLLWQGRGLPTARFELLTDDSDWAAVLHRLGGKVMVKPSCEGSSLGMTGAASVEMLGQAYSLARQYDPTVIAERWLSGREFSVAIVGQEALPAIELQTDQEFYTYDAKYLSEQTRYLCPAPLEDQVLEEINRLSLNAFNCLGCRGWARVDLMMDESGLLMLLEVNTIPGMTDHSLVPRSAREAGMDMSALCERILMLSLEFPQWAEVHS